METTAATGTSQAPAPLPRSLVSRTGFLLAKAHMLCHEMAGEVLKADGLNVKHFGCMSVIADEEPISQQTLGERMRVDRSTIVMLVDDLERRGFVVRRRNPDDRRAYALEATPEGSRWVRGALKRLLKVEREFLAPLDDAEQQELGGLLRRLLAL